MTSLIFELIHKKPKQKRINNPIHTNSALIRVPSGLIHGRFQSVNAGGYFLSGTGQQAGWGWETLVAAGSEAAEHLRSLRQLRKDVKKVVSKAQQEGKHIQLNCDICVQFVEASEFC